MKVTLLPFREELLADAAVLLARRHRRDRLLTPLLPERFEDPVSARVALEAVWRHPRTSGAAAFLGERLLGFLIGDTVFDQLRGRCAWTWFAGHALDDGVDPELYRDLYAAAAPAWLEQGCFDHYVQTPAADHTALDAWFTLGFGHEQAYGLRSLEQVEPVAEKLPFEIRRATLADRDIFDGVHDLIMRHQSGSPVWAIIPPESAAEIREGYAEILQEEGWLIWLALGEGRVLGFQAYNTEKAGPDNLLIPDDCIELSVGATRPEVRGQGIGRALTARSLADARSRGFRCCVTDWRMTNLLSSRFWPRQGFRPAMYRLARRIDPRVAWTRRK